MEDLSGKVAVITGAASGIGAAMASVFGQRGMKLVLADITTDSLQSVAQKLQDDGVECITQETDVSDLAAVERLAATAIDSYGTVNVLCNNAGVSTVGRQWEVSHEDWAWLLGVNLWGPINGTRVFVPHMLSSGQPAHIVNTASVGGLMSGPLVGPYSVAKHGVVGLSKSLRLELFDSNIDVSVLCPGEIATGIVPAMRKRLASTGVTLSEDAQNTMEYLDTSLKGSMDPHEAAELVVEAIVANRFWIMPNAGNYAAMLQQEYDEMIVNVVPAAVAEN